MRSRLALALLVAGPLLPPFPPTLPGSARPAAASLGTDGGAAAADGGSGAAGTGAQVPPPLVVERGEDRPALRIPRDEKLVYGVRVGLGLGALRAGTVTLEAGVEGYRPSLLLETGGAAEGAEVGWLRSTAVGTYGLFRMDSTMETRHLPVEWPRIALLRTHEGDVEKRRELKIGLVDGVPTSQYRRDTDTGAPPGTRVWKKPKLREVPEGSLDMLSAIYLARTLIQDGQQSLVFPLVDKTYVWEMELSRGARERVEVPAGTFDVVEIVLEPEPHPGETKENREEQEEKFEGLFGLQGAIHLWVDAATGIPIRVTGDLPVGFLELHIEALLEDHEGTPPELGRS